MTLLCVQRCHCRLQIAILVRRRQYISDDEQSQEKRVAAFARAYVVPYSPLTSWPHDHAHKSGNTGHPREGQKGYGANFGNDLEVRPSYLSRSRVVSIFHYWRI